MEYSRKLLPPPIPSLRLTPFFHLSVRRVFLRGYRVRDFRGADVAAGSTFVGAHRGRDGPGPAGVDVPSRVRHPAHGGDDRNDRAVLARRPEQAAYFYENRKRVAAHWADFASGTPDAAVRVRGDVGIYLRLVSGKKKRPRNTLRQGPQSQTV